MGQLGTVYQWAHTVRRKLPKVPKAQVVNLAAFSVGLGLTRRVTLSVVAEHLGGLGKPDSVERRFQRFLSSGKLLVKEVFAAWTTWVLGSVRAGGPLVLLVDETSLQDKLKVMVVSLAYRGRAIPLAWRCYHQEHWPTGQVALIGELLQEVAKGVPPHCRVLVEADRGIGNSPGFLRLVEGLGWYYLVRVTCHVRLQLEDGAVQPIKSIPIQRGQEWKARVKAFKKAGWLSAWALVAWGAEAGEPWNLLTNWEPAHGTLYALRMWEEEAFKDMKSNGWQWQRSHVWKPDHADRLWLAMAVAYLYILNLGTRVLQQADLRRLVTRGSGSRRSVFHLGIRLFKYLLHHHKYPPRRIYLIPCQKTVV